MTSSTSPHANPLGPSISGVVAAGAGLAAGEIAAIQVSPDASPYFAVGSSVVDHSPEAVREWAIETFGVADKVALFLGMGLLIAIIAAVAGSLERIRPTGGFAAHRGLRRCGSGRRPRPARRGGDHALPSVIAAAVGVVVLRILVAQCRSGQYEEQSELRVGVNGNAPLTRRFILTAGGVSVAAVALGVIGRRMLADTAETLADRARLMLPRPVRPAPPVPEGTRLDVDGVTPFVTDNDAFYRIDTALQVPTLTTAGWRLRIHGDVEREVVLSWDDLLAMPMVERYVTLACVSNDVGGDLIGNARWLGVPMRDVLNLAGVWPGADLLLSTSADGWTCGTPISAITDGRDALLAVGMNGDPLPVEHGYPVRQVVPGLYGYVSATKWVVDWEVTRFSEAEAYWTSRGWSALGPIKLSSRIDRPDPGRYPAGEVVIAGTAWAQHTGVDRVEVRIDGGEWRPADLAAEYSVDTWRQWRYVCRRPLAITSSRSARSTGWGGPGRAFRPPAPDGATGLDERRYTIT